MKSVNYFGVLLSKKGLIQGTIPQVRACSRSAPDDQVQRLVRLLTHPHFPSSIPSSLRRHLCGIAHLTFTPSFAAAVFLIYLCDFDVGIAVPDNL